MGKWKIDHQINLSTSDNKSHYLANKGALDTPIIDTLRLSLEYFAVLIRFMAQYFIYSQTHWADWQLSYLCTDSELLQRSARPHDGRKTQSIWCVTATTRALNEQTVLLLDRSQAGWFQCFHSSGWLERRRWFSTHNFTAATNDGESKRPKRSSSCCIAYAILTLEQLCTISYFQKNKVNMCFLWLSTYLHENKHEDTNRTDFSHAWGVDWLSGDSLRSLKAFAETILPF